MENNFNFNFHETFYPNIEYISRILELGSKKFIGTKENISYETGIPTGNASGKVRPHIKYAKYMGLIDYDIKDSNYYLCLTDLGKLVYMEDKYLLENLTKYLIHYMLTDKRRGAPQWSFFFREFEHNLNEKISLKYIKDKAKLHFGKEIELGVVKNTYLKDDSLGSLKLIEEQEDQSIIFRKSKIQIEFIFMYAYCLLKSWENTLSQNVKEITMDILENDISFTKAFGFEIFELDEILAELQRYNYITINKQLTPVTIIKNVSANEILNMIYSLLI